MMGKRKRERDTKGGRESSEEEVQVDKRKIERQRRGREKREKRGRERGREIIFFLFVLRTFQAP